MKTYFFDFETCGKFGLPVLLQYAIDDGEIHLVDLFYEPTDKLKSLIEDIVANRSVAHNINFDWQMMQKLYNMLCILDCKRLIDVSVEDLVNAEYESRKGYCLKPHAAVDTMICSIKSDGQSSLMASKSTYIRRVPIKYGEKLARELTERTELPWILFANKKMNPRAEWIVSERENPETGEVDRNFVDIQLKFKPSNSLKDLHKYLFNSETTKFDDIMPDEFPGGPGYCPYVAPLNHNNWVWNGEKLWPLLIESHVEFWRTNVAAREYAHRDIVMLRDLYEHFGSPENDSDSILACQIASVRLYGFNVDIEKMKEMREESIKFVQDSPINVNSPKQVKAYIAEVLDPMEQLIVATGCNADILEKIVKEFTLDEEEDCDCEDQRFCKRCGGTGVVGPGPMEVAKRAKLIEKVRVHKKRIELFDKLIEAGRAYPNFRAVGTKSGRLSGTDGLNFQGVDSSLSVRDLFLLSDEGEVLSGGDYDGQEVAIAGTTMNDEKLLNEMRKGKKIHGLFGMDLFETTYEDIVNNKDEENSRYGRAKSAVFLTIYGGTAHTMAEKSGVDLEICERALNSFSSRFPGVGATRKMISDRFNSLHRKESGGIEYREPSCKYIESIFGFRRYFNTEFYLQRMIYDLCNEIFGDSESKFIQELREDEEAVLRDTKNMRTQKMAGAVASALIGACYSIVNGVIRAANNHLIQSAGRTITVGLQEALWELQPKGIHPFVIRPMSIHDEVAAVTRSDYVEPTSEVVVKTLDKQCEIIPLLMMTWGRNLPSWGSMKKVDESGDWDYVHAGIVL